MAFSSSISGLASGIQWRDMLDQIMQAEAARRLTPVQTQASLEQKRITAFNQLNGLVGTLTTAAKGLRDGTGLQKSTAAVSASPLSGRTLLSATAGATAVSGTHQVEVLSLARAHSMASGTHASATAALGLTDGSFTVNGKTIAVTGADSLNAVRDRINAANAGVTAAVVQVSTGQYRLSLASKTLGAAGIAYSDGSEGTGAELGLATLVAGSDALAKIDGITVRRSSNTISDAIEGVTLNLLGLDTAGRSTTVSGAGLTLARDPRTIGAGTYEIAFQAGTGTPSASTSTPSLNVQSFAGVAESSYAVELTATTTRGGTGSTPDLSVTSAGSFAVGTHAVNATVTRSVSATQAGGFSGLSTVSSSGAAGDFAVEVTALAARASTVGSGLTTYSGSSGDTITITDAAGTAATVSLSDGDDVDAIVARLNTDLSAAGVTVQAVNDGGQLRLTATDAAGSASTFSVSSSSGNVAAQLGINDTTYTGSDIQGTIDGVAATAVSADELSLGGLRVQYTGNATGVVGTAHVSDAITATIGGTAATWDGGAQTFTTADGLVVQYAGAPITASGSLGSVTITETTEITGGTIGGEAATWDSVARTLTADSGTAADGLVVEWTGPDAAGAVGSVTVSSVGVTIDGEAAVWDAATSTIRGAVGSRFEGVEIGYAGSTAAGRKGELVVESSSVIEVEVKRDDDAFKAGIKQFTDAYNAVRRFYDAQNATSGSQPLYHDPLLRSTMSELKNVLLKGDKDLTDPNYRYLSQAGIALDRQGLLQGDADKVLAAYDANPDSVKALFASIGDKLAKAAEVFGKPAIGTIALKVNATTESIATLNRRADEVQLRLDDQLERMTREWVRMEEAMSRMQAQGSWLSSQISSLPGYY